MKRGTMQSTTAASRARRTNRPRPVESGNARQPAPPCAAPRAAGGPRRADARRVLGVGEREVALHDPELGVLGVHHLVQPDADVVRTRMRSSRPVRMSSAAAEQLVAVEVHGARVELDVAGLGQPRADQRPHRVQALEHPRVVVAEALVDGVEPAALRGGPVKGLREAPPVACGWRPSAGHRPRVAVQVRDAARAAGDLEVAVAGLVEHPAGGGRLHVLERPPRARSCRSETKNASAIRSPTRALMCAIDSISRNCGVHTSPSSPATRLRSSAAAASTRPAWRRA